MSISSIRRDYQLESLLEIHVDSNPFNQFTSWWKEALSAEIDEVNAMALSTVMANGKPSSRIVLLKGYDEAGFVFFTNYDSHKGDEAVGELKDLEDELMTKSAPLSWFLG